MCDPFVPEIEIVRYVVPSPLRERLADAARRSAAADGLTPEAWEAERQRGVSPVAADLARCLEAGIDCGPAALHASVNAGHR